MKTRIDAGQQQRQNTSLDKAGSSIEEFKARVRQRWQQISDEQLDRISGRREQLSRELERTYGLSHEDAEAEIDDFEGGEMTAAGVGSGRGPTERMREFGTGNQQGGLPHHDKHRLH